MSVQKQVKNCKENEQTFINDVKSHRFKNATVFLNHHQFKSNSINKHTVRITIHENGKEYCFHINGKLRTGLDLKELEEKQGQ